MGRPKMQGEVLARVDSDYQKLVAEVGDIQPAERDGPGACETWSVKDILAHLDAWHDLFLGWERVGVKGDMPELPLAGYSWKDTPALNEMIWQRTRDDAWDEVALRLSGSHSQIRSVIETYDEEGLFEKARYRWTGSTSVGSYAVSATTSHYDWATKLIRRFGRAQRDAP